MATEEDEAPLLLFHVSMISLKEAVKPGLVREEQRGR